MSIYRFAFSSTDMIQLIIKSELNAINEIDKINIFAVAVVIYIFNNSYLTS